MQPVAVIGFVTHDEKKGCVQNWDQLEVKELSQTSRRSMFSFQDAVAHQRSYGRYENCI